MHEPTAATERQGEGPSSASMEIAYVLKGYPRLSELFIASEIHRLEQQGVRLQLFVLKPADETRRHPVVDRIVATPRYLPATTSLTGTGLPRWLARNVRPFLRPLWRCARRRPRGLVRAAGAAFAQSVRARRSVWSAPRRLYVKELLYAIALADQVLEEPRVGHLHAHFAHGATTVTWLSSMICGIPFSFTGHAKDIYCETLNPAGLLRRKLRAARFAVTCTDANREHLLRVAPGARVHRVYHGLNADFARLLADSDEQPAHADVAFRVLAVGRLVEKKGFDVLVDACEALGRRGIPIDVTIAGEDGDHATELRRRIARSGLTGRIRLPGAMSQAALFREYQRAAAFCLPCRVLENGDRDGIPNVLVEAMASGAPVVTTEISGIPELVEDGVNGLLVRPDDPEALARALESLYRDRELATRLSLQGRRTVERRFDGDELAASMAALFTGACA